MVLKLFKIKGKSSRKYGLTNILRFLKMIFLEIGKPKITKYLLATFLSKKSYFLDFLHKLKQNFILTFSTLLVP